MTTDTTVTEGGFGNLRETPNRNAPEMACVICLSDIPPDGHVVLARWPVRREALDFSYTVHSDYPGPVCVPCYQSDPSGYKLTGDGKYPLGGRCQWCGRGVTASHHHSRRWLSCSPECAYELRKEGQNARRAHLVGIVHAYTCGDCGAAFTSKRSSRWRTDSTPTYCSNACRQRAYRKRTTRRKQSPTERKHP